MRNGVRVEELYGIGKRFDIDCGSAKQRISVIVHNDGSRELYAFEWDTEDPTAVIPITEEQARVLAAILSGTYYTE